MSLWDRVKSLVGIKPIQEMLLTGEPGLDDSISYVVGAWPTGFIFPTAMGVRPHGFLPCDGAERSRAIYELLFMTIGTTYGAGNGTTTFNVPDLRGRMLLGAGQGLTAEGGTTGTNRVLTQVGGAETHTLTSAQMPAHSHSMSGVTYDRTNYAADASLTLLGSGNRVTGYTATALAGSTTSAGTGNAHPIMPPYGVVQWWIRF